MPTTRRDWMAAVGFASGAGFLSTTGADGRAPEERRRVLRLAHLTDIHVQPERGAEQGMVACLHHVQKLPDRPDLILIGGDCVMDAFGQTEARTRLQWDIWRRVLASECSIPVESCVGNHDIWGWDRARSGAEGTEANYGKAWALEALGLERPYRSFDRAGWHWVVLDSTQPGLRPGTYKARLDEEQFAWLAADLAAVPPGTPTLVLSHIPILSASAYFDGPNERLGNWIVPGAWMHLDARRIKDLFAEHPDVRLCLSGHIHLVDRVDYNGVTYLCNGAVCGGWWKGNYQECAPGYEVVDLFDDGTFEHEYVTYGWEPRA